jgi:hypothetical protein
MIATILDSRFPNRERTCASGKSQRVNRKLKIPPPLPVVTLWKLKLALGRRDAGNNLLHVLE